MELRRRMLSTAAVVILLAAGVSLVDSQTLVPIYHLLLGQKRWQAPTSLIAQGESARNITISWKDNSDGEDGFAIETDTSGSWELFYTTAANTQQALLGAHVWGMLDPDQIYHFRVRAYKGSASAPTMVTEYSNIATAATRTAPVTTPAIPVAMDAVPVSTSAISVSWNDQSNDEEMFRLERSLDDCNSFSWLASLPYNTTSYTDTGLDADRIYCYRVKAYNMLGYSGYSNSASTRTMNSPVPPVAPTDLQAQPCPRGAKCIVLDWTDNSNNEKEFYIQRKLLGGTTWEEVGTESRNVTRHYDSYLIAAFAYYTYRVGARNYFGTTYSNETTIMAVAGEPKPTPPQDAPSATALSGNAIQVTWIDSSDNEEKFVVNRSQTGDILSFTPVGEVGAGVTTFNDSGLPPETSYYYTISACNFAGCGNNGLSGSATTLSAASLNPPFAPTSLTVSVISQDSSSLNLSWIDHADNEDGFKIYRNTINSKPASPTLTVAPNTTTLKDTGLSGCTTYYYWVESFNGAGTSSTATGNNTTPPSPPGGMISSQGTVLNGIYVDWNAVSCAQGYNISQLDGQTDEWKRLNQLPGSITTNYTTIGQVPPMTYQFYRVTGVDSNGKEGTPSQHIVGWAASAIPTGTAATRGTYSDRIILSWKPVQTCPQGQGVNARYINLYDISWSDAKDGAFRKFKSIEIESGHTDPAMPVASSPDPVRIAITNDDANQYFPGLTQGAKYYFVVQSVYKKDLMCDDLPDSPVEYESASSTPAEGWIQAQASNYLPGPATMTASDGQLCKIELSWSPVPGAASYRVYRSASILAPTWSLLGSKTSTSMTEVVDSTLHVIPWTSYWYIVTPVSAAGVEGYASPYDGGYASRAVGLIDCY